MSGDVSCLPFVYSCMGIKQQEDLGFSVIQVADDVQVLFSSKIPVRIWLALK